MSSEYDLHIHAITTAFPPAGCRRRPFTQASELPQGPRGSRSLQSRTSFPWCPRPVCNPSSLQGPEDMFHLSFSETFCIAVSSMSGSHPWDVLLDPADGISLRRPSSLPGKEPLLRRLSLGSDASAGWTWACFAFLSLQPVCILGQRKLPFPLWYCMEHSSSSTLFSIKDENVLLVQSRSLMHRVCLAPALSGVVITTPILRRQRDRSPVVER